MTMATHDATSPTDSFFSQTTAELVSSVDEALSAASSHSHTPAYPGSSSNVAIDVIPPTPSSQQGHSPANHQFLDTPSKAGSSTGLKRNASTSTRGSVYSQDGEGTGTGESRTLRGSAEDGGKEEKDFPPYANHATHNSLGGNLSGGDSADDSVSFKSAHRTSSAPLVDLGLGVEQFSYPPASARSRSPGKESSTINIGGSDAEKDGGAESDLPPVPDGGLRAWLTVLGGWLMLFASFGYVNAWGVFQSYLATYEYPEKTDSDISWIGSVQLCLFFLMALVAGPLFSAGHIKFCLRLGSALWVTSIFLIPVATEYWHSMLIQGVLGGMGVGLLFLPSMSIQTHWFARHRNLAIGIVASGSSIGGICFPIMLNKLFVNPNVGYAAGVRASGYLIVGCLVIANLIMSPNPTRVGLPRPKPPPLKQLFTGPYTSLVVGAMILNFGLWFPNFFIQLYAQAKGVEENLAFYTLAIFNAGSFVGRTVPNLIADRTGPSLVQTVCCLGAGILLFLMNLCTTAGPICVFAFLYGLLSGGFISLVSPVIVSMSSAISEIGLRQGIAFLIVAGAAVGGNPIAAKIFANNGGEDFWYPILFAAVMTTAGALVIGTGTLMLMKQRGTWKV